MQPLEESTRLKSTVFRMEYQAAQLDPERDNIASSSVNEWPIVIRVIGRGKHARSRTIKVWVFLSGYCHHWGMCDWSDGWRGRGGRNVMRQYKVVFSTSSSPASQSAIPAEPHAALVILVFLLWSV